MLKNIWIAFFVLAAANKVMANESFYTSVAVKDCLTIASSELDEEAEIDFYKAQCPGMSGYQVFVEGGDLRYNLQLKYNGYDVALASLANFHDLGSDKIEWRYERKSGSVRVMGLIYRLSFQDYSEETGDMFNTSKLYVVRLKGSKSCVVAEISNSSSMNEMARNAADDENLACLE